MEWIEGPTLNEIKKPLNLDYALSAINSILQIVDKCHGMHIHHRDLKPDNLIARHNDLNQTVLVDFGMSWSKRSKESARIFDTPIGSELGNRFLRLPEYAPGQIVHDPRSDMTMIVGLLFYLLTGKAPRQLLNSNNQMPHEEFTDSFSRELLADPRWPRLKRVFHIGFQSMLDMRFQTIKLLADRLADLNPPDKADDVEALQSELSQINDVLNTEIARKLRIEEGALKVAADVFVATLKNAVSGKGYEIAGNGPTLDRAQKAIKINFVLHRTQTETPTAKFCHLINISDGVVAATVQIEEGKMEKYYAGELADIDGLKDAAQNRAKRLFIDLLQVMKSKLEQHYS
jgi:serine/threonine protein kinase